MVTFYPLNVPSGFHLDGSPLLNAHNPVGCSFIDWLCPPLLILAGIERKPLHAKAVPNTIPNLGIAECIYKSLPSNLLNPWSPIPLELSHSTLLPHITYKKFCVPSSCFCSPLSGVIFNACQGVIEARMSLLPLNSAWRISITNNRQSSSLAVIQVIHLVQCGRQRLKKTML